jgi:ABC-type oligopeptide transport system substrate-binding subunit
MAFDSRSKVRLGALLVIFILAIGVLSNGLARTALAQKPSGKPPLEEEEKRKPLGKPPRDEEPDMPRTSIDPDEVDQPDVKNLYRGLQHAHDEVTVKGESAPRTVMPIPYWLGPRATFQGTVDLKTYDAEWKLQGAKPVLAQNILAVNYYEEIALAEVGKFLRGGRTASPLSRHERYEAAERVLEAVIFSPARQVRQGLQWKDVDARLKDKLQEVRNEHLVHLVSDQDWDKAIALAREMARKYSTDMAVQKKIAQGIAPLVELPLKQEKYDEVRKRLAALEMLPGSAEVAEPIRKRLHDQAANYFKLAQEAREKKDQGKANEMIIRAGKLWPRLEGLREFNKDHPILGVGVRELPERFSPATAVTDSERQAVELIFDSLTKLREQPGAAGTMSQFYRPSLATGLPWMTPRGRLFHLDPKANWSNGDRVTEADVRMTVQLLRGHDLRTADGGAPDAEMRAPWTGFDPAWANLVEPALPGSNMHQVVIPLRQGMFDPLAVLTFKILPTSANLARPDDQAFSQQPVGSGPFQLVDRERQAWERNMGGVVFVANSTYERSRPGSVPQVEEIRFYRSENPVDDFKEGRLHLLLDVPPERVKEIQDESRGLSGLVSIRTLPNRRIHFLAVNHRRRALQNEALRRALAHAVNRDDILNKVFRGDLTAGVQPPHRPLTGPFPPGCWACKPNLESKLAGGAAAGRDAPVRLSLKYPSDDLRVREACMQIKAQVGSAGVELNLEPRSPHQLHHEVEVLQDYELAYYSFDYASEAYWLWPLFNTHPQALAAGGTNYLGYQNDGELESAFQNAMARREFSKIQQAMYNIHEQFNQKMPFIPLWQLDTVVAIHKDLKADNIDPLLIFSDVERWQLLKK